MDEGGLSSVRCPWTLRRAATVLLHHTQYRCCGERNRGKIGRDHATNFVLRVNFLVEHVVRLWLEP